MRSIRVLAFIFLAALGLAAQTFRGGIVGTVTDATGAALPGAQITVTNIDTGLTRSTTTSAEGNYFVPELPLGGYNVTVAQSGFRTQTVTGIRVEVSANTRVDIKMSPGQVKETVTVTAEVPIVETTGNTLGGIIEAREAARMPINGRDYIKLLTLVPGANADPSSVNDAPGSFGMFTINGNRGRANNFLLDGTDMNDGYRNDPAINEAGVFGTPATLLPVDALAEVAILSNMEAEYGRNSGAVVNIVTKSGTNELHGGAFEFFRNNALDARNYFNAKPNPQNTFHNNQFGGSLGGPFIKDRTFWFVAYEGWRENGGIPNIESVPTQARVNAFTAGGGVVNGAISNLLGRNPWGVPLPATGDDPADSASNSTLQVSDKFTNRVDSMILRLDHHLGGQDKHDLLSGRYFFGDSDQSFPLALGGGTTVPNFNTVTPTRVQVLSLSYTHVWTPKLLMEVRGGWNRFAEGFFPQDRDFNPATIGLNNTVGPQDFGLPLIRFHDGTTALGANNSVPRHRFDSNWQYFTNLSYNSGKHNWKFGYEFRRTTINQFYDLGYRSRLTFDSFEDFLAGVASGGLQFAGNSQRTTHQNNHGFYAQDNYRLTRRLTANLGVRWDYYGVPSEEKNRFSLFDTSTASLIPVGVSGGRSKLYPGDHNNFAPRLSFAWDVLGTSKTVVRAGWGLYYDAFSQDFFIGHFPFNTFNPGPAYNGIGPDAILAGSATVADADDNLVIVPGTPLFSFSPTTDAWTVDQKIRTPYIQNYNLNIEQQFGSNIAVQIGYVGSTGKKLFRFRDLNQLDPATGNAPFPAFVYVNQFESTATSNYNGLQLQLKVRGWHGLTSSMSYGWSHAIDNASDGEDYVPNAAQPDNSLNPRAEKANSNFDRRQNFTWNFAYEFPKTGSRLTSGWALEGILRIADGQPYNLNSFEGYNGTGEFFERPDVIGNPFAGTRTPDRILNLGAFAAPCTWSPVDEACIDGTQHFGNLRRNAFVGPNFRNFDFSLVKDTKLGEKANMQWRVDFFNLFNHPNFSNPLLPNFVVDLETNGLVAPAAGDSRCAAAPFTGCRALGQGFLPITATPDVGIGNPFLGGGGPRNIQLAVRFSF